MARVADPVRPLLRMIVAKLRRLCERGEEVLHRHRRAGTESICYATQNRPRATPALVAVADVILAIGATNGSNFNCLCDIPKSTGVSRWL